MSERILHDSLSPDFRRPFGAVREGETVRLRLGVPVSCPCRKVKTVLLLEEDPFLSLTMTRESEKEGIVFYTVSFALPKSGLYFYHFEILKQDGSFRLFRLGLSDTNMEEGKAWQITCCPKDYAVPASCRGKIMYQIFPDRFAIGGKRLIEEKDTPFYLHASPDEPPLRGPAGDGRWNTDFYGGNFLGIMERLDELRSLGVSLIYLNPIFKSPSNHRYDTSDYLKPDPMLGTEEDFAHLCSEAAKRGIRIILDGVFSHTGSDSVYFKSALSDPDSPYRDWYLFRSFPDDYECWWGIKTLPCVRETEKSYLDFIVRRPDSVISKWISLGASGFRLDVADELPDEFIAELRKHLRLLKEDALLIGEVWEDASTKISYGVRRKYFTGGELDGVMNYPFRTAVLDYASGKIPKETFASAVTEITENYPFDALLCSTVFLSSHDTARFRTVLGENDEAVEKAIALQTFLPGILCVYYGDEVGMEGGEDPMNRGFYRENPAGTKQKEIYRRFLSLREKSEALRTGSLRIETETGLTLIRETEKERALLILPENGENLRVILENKSF